MKISPPQPQGGVERYDAALWPTWPKIYPEHEFNILHIAQRLAC